MDLYSCTFPLVACRAEPREQSEMISQLLYGEEVTLLEHHENWAKIRSEIDQYVSYIDRKIFESFTLKAGNDERILITAPLVSTEKNGSTLFILAGSFVHSEILSTPQKSLSFEDIIIQAKKWLGTPYLWGGKSIFGVDCSGFTQIIYRTIGVEIKRDASQQVQEGKEISLDLAKTGDLAFFDNKEGKTTHVGIILKTSESIRIIHSSGEVRIDSLLDEGIFNEEKKQFTHSYQMSRTYR